MSVPLARRLAGPSFSFNVRFDQQLMTKRKEGATVPLKIGNADFSYVSEYEVFDVKEGEVLVAKRMPGRVADGFCRCFSSLNGWNENRGLPAVSSTDAAKAFAKNEIKKKLEFIGIAVTEHKALKIAKMDQGFVAMASGIVTIINNSGGTLHPGMPLTWDICHRYPVQQGVHSKKVQFMLRAAKAGEEIVGKALSYSKDKSTVDILLHPVNVV